MKHRHTDSIFTGGLLGLIGTNILVAALFCFTAGLGLPWCVCIKQDWETRHTVLDGKRLSFDGDGLRLFGNWIKWWLLCVVTLVIYGFWIPIKIRQWTAKHIHFAGAAAMQETDANPSASKFTGGLLGLLGINVLVVALFVFTIGLGLPWCICIKRNWMTKHTVIDDERLVFDGDGLQLFGNYVKWWIFSMLTLGIYAFWMTIKFRQWTTKHVHLANISAGPTSNEPVSVDSFVPDSTTEASTIPTSVPSAPAPIPEPDSGSPAAQANPSPTLKTADFVNVLLAIFVVILSALLYAEKLSHAKATKGASLAESAQSANTMVDSTGVEPPAPAGGEFARRFRLVGIIHGGSVTEPMAVFDDRIKELPLILSRGEEAAPGVILTAVNGSTATLAGPDGEVTLRLERRDPDAARATEAAAKPLSPKTREEAAARFGGREIYPGRWIYDRGKVKAYYDELFAEPFAERSLAVFDSMEPAYVEDLNGKRRVDGYRLVVKGEPDLFLAGGLQDGDVVKSINSMRMTNRRRAEDMIAAFATGTGTMFVFEIERDGRTFKQLYEFKDVPPP